jgi:YidC/Oxa1 family membrane protein insertase
MGRDTIPLDAAPLRVARPSGSTGLDPAPLSFSGDLSGHPVTLEYSFVPDSFLVRVRGTIAGAPPGTALLVDLPRTLMSNEPDTLDDISHLAVSYRPSRGDVNSVGFSKLDSAETRVEPGPLDWVATRNKYFLVVYRADPKHPFSALRLQGAPRVGKAAPELGATAALPVGADGTIAFDIYAGPQDFERLQRLGGDLDQVNPYAGWLHGVVQPFATIVMKALLWMKRTTQLNYGWVLVLFGVLIRLALWPLNQGAMRTSMKMQRLQPELQAIQKKYSDDPKRQQEAIMKVYKDHGMSPLSPLMGCLPMLLPMPVLFALYFVFQNTIEFRGVPFLWLPDISLRDPYFITPLLMGASMFVMSWIGLKGAPPNPQAKMMSYMMPVMLTVLFLNFASGLNLYYAVQNLAAIPQQWLLARERAKAGPMAMATISGPAPAVKRRS